jgi:hypothetical protein
MFLAVKKPLQVEVSLIGETVRVKPLNTNKAEGIIYRTMARCEEFLAQMFLQEKEGSYTGLKNFFKQRGWHIAEA